MRRSSFFSLAAFAALLLARPAAASSGDPQVKTDHPWYPGELSCSTFERLFKTQAELYKRVTGRSATTDEDKALASWYWRNLNYAHAEEGTGDYFDKGYPKYGRNRGYWRGLFAHGFALCGTTHAQWCAEMDELLGHCRGRVVGVKGHNSFEVYLTGGAYGAGRWALLDHDISTVIFDHGGTRLVSIKEISQDLNNYANPNYKPGRQRGWRVGGLYDGDPKAYATVRSAEYLAGYADPPPMLHLRAGESVRRYLKPGLDDGKTFVFWGRNYKVNGIGGLSRHRTWVNQPEKMYGAKKNAGYKPGRARHGNAVFKYEPDFAGGSYKEGVADEGDGHVTFEFSSPYVIACTPPNDKPWGVYEAGAKNGLVLTGKMKCGVKVSTDCGKTWVDAGTASDGMDLTDHVKGHGRYLLRLGAPAKELSASGLVIRTVCQCNQAMIPRLREGPNKVTFLASGSALAGTGPNKDQGTAHVVEGAVGSKKVTLEVKTPRGEKAVRLYAAAHIASGNPPRPEFKCQIDCSTDGGKTWKAVARDWQITRRAYEPGDFWSQSYCWGDTALKDADGPVRVRFANDGGKTYMRVEAYLVYKLERQGSTEVTFAWKEEGAAEPKKASRTYPGRAGRPGREDTSWTIECGKGTESVWVEYSAK